MAARALTRPRARAWVAVVVLAVLILAPLTVLPRLTVNNVPAVYFPPDAPAIVLDERIRETFPQDGVLVVLFQGEGLYQGGFLSALGRVAQTLEADAKVERVLTLTTVDHIEGTVDGFSVDWLIDPQLANQRSPGANRTRVMSDRFAPGFLASRDGDAVALMVRPVALSHSLDRLALLERTHQAIRAEDIEDRVGAIAGQIALDIAEFRSMVRDTLWFVPVTTILGLVLIGVLFRRPMAVVLSLAAIGAVVAPTLGLIALWGRPYTLVTALVPPLITALTVALLVHLFNGVYLAARRGYRGGQRVSWALAEVRRPAFFTALTTAAGLASLALSPIRPIQSLGIVAAAGTVLLWAVVVGALPPILAAFDTGRWRPPMRGLGWVDAGVRACARLAIRRPGRVVLIVGLVVVLCVPFLSHVRAETDFYAFFSAEHPLIRSTRVVESELSGVTRLEVVFDAGSRDGLKDPGRLAALKQFQDWVDRLPEVDRTFSMMDVIEEMNWAFHGEDERFRRLPDERRLISQYLFVYDGRDLFDVVDRELSQTRVTLSLNVHGANAIRQVMGRIREHLERHPVSGVTWNVAGLGRLLADQERLLIQGQLRSLVFVLGLIFVLMLILWRSVPAAVLCLIPNLAPILFIFALMGLSGIRLDMATAMIASVAIGVAVDDTIHIYSGYMRRRRRGRSLVLSLVRTYRHAGRAITATTLVLCAQFLILTTSQFQPTVHFGLLTAIGLLAALVFDLLLLPAILTLVNRRRTGTGGSPQRRPGRGDSRT